MPSPAAGKTANPKTPTKLERRGQDDKAQDDDNVATQVKDKADNAGKDAASQVDKKDSFDLARAEPEPLKDDDEDDSAAQAESGADEGTEKSGFIHVSDDSNDQDEGEQGGKKSSSMMSGARQAGSAIAGGAQKAAGRATGSAQKAAEGDTSGAADEAKDTAGDAKDTVEDTADGAKDTAGDAADEAKDTADGAKETAEGATGVDLSILDGLKVADDGLLYDGDNAIGRLAEGDAEDLVGYTVSGKGEILDDDGDLVGLVEIIPEKEKELLQKAKDEAGNLPGLDILKGLSSDPTGLIYNDDGDVVGQVTEGNPSDLKGLKLNEKGEFIKDGKVVGKAQIHPDYLDQVKDQAQDAGDDAQEAAGDAVDEAGEAVDEAGEHVDEAAEELPGIEALEGKELGSDGFVRDDQGQVIGEVAEGDAKELKGMSINEKGEVVDAEGNVIGKVQLAEGAEEIIAGSAPDLRILENLKVNKKGKILDSDGEIIGELIDGDASQCAGKKVNARGEVIDGDKVIGRVKVVPGDAANEAMKELEQQLGDLQKRSGLDILDGLKVNSKGMILNEDGEPIGELVDGDLETCKGKKCDDNGNVLDAKGKPIGRVRTLAQRDEEEEPQAEEAIDDGLPPLSILEGLKCNKAGKIINDKGAIVGELVEGDPKKISRSGASCDEKGQFWDSKGHVIGRAKTVEVEDADEDGPFAGLEGLVVVKDGFVQDENENIVGKIVEGDAKKLVGRAVDEDGDIIDKKGSVVGRAERYDAPEEEQQAPADLSALEGTTINKRGYAVDHSGRVIGQVVEGDAKKLLGCKVDGQGQIWNSSGKVVGRCELAEDFDNTSDGPFGAFEGNKIQKDGTVQSASGDIIGRVVDGDVKSLAGYTVDPDGEITDRNGNVIGRAERWEPEEKERKKSPMSGMMVNREGEIRGPDGEVLGRLTSGDLGQCIGLEIDDNGNVVDQDGNIVGGATLLENIQEEETEEVDEDEQQRKEIANKMSDICQQTLERIQPVMKQIQEHMEKADRTPKDELDEEELVNHVKPLIEEGHRILNECNGSLRGLDPDGSIAARAKGRAATKEATPEEYRLADLLKELTQTVVKTIDDAKKKLNDMPHAKKKLNPLWGLLTEPLFQILAAVGLLLSGVLGLVGRLLSALGLGGLVNGLLGGLGIDKLLGGLGLGSLFGSKDEKEKKKNPASNIPLVGGLLGGGK